MRLKRKEPTRFIREVTPEQRTLLAATVQFANLPTIDSTDQVHDLFTSVPLVGPKFRVLAQHEAANFKADQDKLRGWLLKISERRGAEIVTEVATGLKALDTITWFDPDRRELLARYRVQGVEAAYTLAVALLLSPSMHLAGRLGYCSAPGCERFTIDLELRRGRPWRFCGVEHRDAADLERAKKAYAEQKVRDTARTRRRIPR